MYITVILLPLSVIAIKICLFFFKRLTYLTMFWFPCFKMTPPAPTDTFH